MLPSMPLLMTPMKVVNEDSSDTSNDSPVQNNLNENENSNEKQSTANVRNLAADERDNLLDIENNAGETCQMIADSSSDNIHEKDHSPDKRSLSEPLLVQKKKKKNHHKKMIVALTPESGALLDASAQNFAEAYFQKVRSQVDDEKWNLFVQELVNFEEQEEKDPVGLYRRIEQLLGANDLSEQFLAFLLPEQVSSAGKFMAFLETQRMMDFCRKMNILLMKRQMRQVLEALEELTQRGSSVTLQEVKDVVLPLLRSSPLLTDRFLQLLPPERPPDSLMTDFETVDLNDDSLFETISVPDLPDPYGNENCVCGCHNAQKNRHCLSCGVKYVNGRVYVQHGKVLRPAKVTFEGAKHADLRQWGGERSRSSRKRFHPSAAANEHRHNADSEDDSGAKKSPKTPKTPRMRGSRSKVMKKDAIDSKDEALDGICPLMQAKNSDIADNIKENILEDCEERNSENYEHDFDEIVMEECNTEEEEEEDMRDKVMHSENDSSMDAEDLSKEIESGNDCSFEDEELEDFEDLDIAKDDSPKPTEDELKDMFEPNNHTSEGIAENDCRKEEIKLTELSNLTCEKNNEDESLKVKMGEECATSALQQGMEIEIKVESSVELKLNPDNMVDVENRNHHNNVIILSDIINATTSNYDSTTSAKVEKIEDTTNIDQIKMEPNSKNVQNENARSTSNVDLTVKEWTREEDQIILQTFQLENELEQTFETASLQLPNRSKEEIQQRFEVLLKLLKEMISVEPNNK